MDDLLNVEELIQQADAKAFASDPQVMQQPAPVGGSIFSGLPGFDSAEKVAPSPVGRVKETPPETPAIPEVAKEEPQTNPELSTVLPNGETQEDEDGGRQRLATTLQADSINANDAAKVVKYAGKLDLPESVIQSMDNRELEQMSAEVTKSEPLLSVLWDMVKDSPAKYALERENLPLASRVISKLTADIIAAQTAPITADETEDTATESVEDPQAAWEEYVRKNGYTEEQLAHLESQGFKLTGVAENGDYEFESDMGGSIAYVKNPAPAEFALKPGQEKRVVSSGTGDIKTLLQNAFNERPANTKQGVYEEIQALSGMIGVMNVLENEYPKWRNFSEKEFQEALHELSGSYPGIERFQDSYKFFQKRGAAEYTNKEWVDQFLEIAPVFIPSGMGLALKTGLENTDAAFSSRLGMGAKDLARIAEGFRYNRESLDRYDYALLRNYLRDMANEMRGGTLVRNVWDSIVKSFGYSVNFRTVSPFHLRLDAGAAASGKAFLGHLGKMGTVNVVANAPVSITEAITRGTVGTVLPGASAPIVVKESAKDAVADIANDTLDNFIEGFSEGIGDLIAPAVNTAVVKGLMKSPFRGKVRFIRSTLAKARSKPLAAYTRRLFGQAHFNGYVWEVMEELTGDALRGLPWAFSQIADTRFGRIDSPFFSEDPEEFGEYIGTTALSLLVQGLLHTGVRGAVSAGYVIRNRKALNRVVEASAAMDAVPISEEMKNDYANAVSIQLNGAMEGGNKDQAALDPESARILFQTDHEALAKLGVSADSIRQAEESGRVIPIRLSDVVVKLTGEEAKRIAPHLDTDPNAKPISEKTEEKIKSLTNEAVARLNQVQKEVVNGKEAIDRYYKLLIDAGKTPAEAQANTDVMVSVATYLALHNSDRSFTDIMNNLLISNTEEEQFLNQYRQALTNNGVPNDLTEEIVGNIRKFREDKAKEQRAVAEAKWQAEQEAAREAEREKKRKEHREAYARETEAAEQVRLQKKAAEEEAKNKSDEARAKEHEADLQLRTAKGKKNKQARRLANVKKHRDEAEKKHKKAKADNIVESQANQAIADTIAKQQAEQREQTRATNTEAKALKREKWYAERDAKEALRLAKKAAEDREAELRSAENVRKAAEKQLNNAAGRALTAEASRHKREDNVQKNKEQREAQEQERLSKLETEKVIQEIIRAEGQRAAAEKDLAYREQREFNQAAGQIIREDTRQENVRKNEEQREAEAQRRQSERETEDIIKEIVGEENKKLAAAKELAYWTQRFISSEESKALREENEKAAREEREARDRLKVANAEVKRQEKEARDKEKERLREEGRNDLATAIELTDAEAEVAQAEAEVVQADQEVEQAKAAKEKAKGKRKKAEKQAEAAAQEREDAENKLAKIKADEEQANQALEKEFKAEDAALAEQKADENRPADTSILDTPTEAANPPPAERKVKTPRKTKKPKAPVAEHKAEDMLNEHDLEKLIKDTTPRPKKIAEEAQVGDLLRSPGFDISNVGALVTRETIMSDDRFKNYRNLIEYIDLFTALLNKDTPVEYRYMPNMFNNIGGAFSRLNGKIVVNLNTETHLFGKATVLPLAAHEVTHSFRQKNPEQFKILEEIVFGYAGVGSDAAEKSFTRYISSRRNIYPKNSQIAEELVCDTMGVLSTDSRFISYLQMDLSKNETHKNAVKQFLEYIKNFLEKVLKALRRRGPTALDLRLMGMYTEESLEAMRKDVAAWLAALQNDKSLPTVSATNRLLDAIRKQETPEVQEGLKPGEMSADERAEIEKQAKKEEEISALLETPPEGVDVEVWDGAKSLVSALAYVTGSAYALTAKGEDLNLRPLVQAIKSVDKYPFRMRGLAELLIKNGFSGDRGEVNEAFDKFSKSYDFSPRTVEEGKARKPLASYDSIRDELIAPLLGGEDTLKKAKAVMGSIVTTIKRAVAKEVNTREGQDEKTDTSGDRATVGKGEVVSTVYDQTEDKDPTINPEHMQRRMDATKATHEALACAKRHYDEEVRKYKNGDPNNSVKRWFFIRKYLELTIARDKKGNYAPVRPQDVLNYLKSEGHPGANADPKLVSKYLNAGLEQLKQETAEYRDLLHQSNEKGQHKGAIIRLNDLWHYCIGLFKGKEDASTIVHEQSHYMFLLMKTMVDAGIADDQMQHDYETLLHWANRNLPDDKTKALKKAQDAGDMAEAELIKWELEVHRQEDMANAFVQYLLEGVIPADPRRSGALATMSALLRSVYKGAMAMDVPIAEDVREIFDRVMCAERTAARDVILEEAAAALDTTMLGLNEAERKFMRGMLTRAKEQASAEVYKELFTLEKGFKPEWNKAAGEAAQQNIECRAVEYIRNNGKLSEKQVREFLDNEGCPESDRDALVQALRQRDLLSRVGKLIPADVLAELHPEGLNTAQEVLTWLTNCPSAAEYKKQVVNQLRVQFYESFNGTVVATQANAYMQTIIQMGEYIAKMAKVPWMDRRAVMATRIATKINGMTIGALRRRDRTTVANIRNAMKQAVKNVNAGDYMSALRYTDTVLATIEEAKAIRKAVNDYSATHDLAQQIVHARRGLIEGMCQEAAQDLALRCGFTSAAPSGPNKLTDIENDINRFRPDNDKFAFADFLKADSITPNDLTYSQLSDLKDAFTLLRNRGREQVKGEKSEKRLVIEEYIQRMLGELSGRKEKFYKVSWRPENGNGLHNALGAFGGLWRKTTEQSYKLRDFMSRFGNFKDNSVFNELYTRLAVDQSAMDASYRSLMLELGNRIRGLQKELKNLPKQTLNGLPAFSEVSSEYGCLRRWTPAAVIAACLNMGNEGNRQRLANNFADGEAALPRIASVLTLEQWQTIQDIWNKIEGSEVSAQMFKTFRNLNYYDLRREGRSAFQVQTADGQMALVDGGYYPISYAVHYSDLPKRNEGSGTKPNDRSNFLAPFFVASTAHERVKTDSNPLSLNLADLARAMYETAVYGFQAENHRLLDRLFSNDTVKKKIQKTMSYEMYDGFKSLLDYVSHPERKESSLVDTITVWARGILASSALFGNPSVVAMQFTSFPYGVNELGSHYFTALTEATLHPKRLRKMIYEKSGLMADRASLKDIDLDLITRKLQNGQQLVASELRDVGYSAMRLADMVVAVPAWYGAYLKAQSEFKSEKECVAYADEFVAKTQGGSRSLDMSLIQLTSMGRAITPFFSAVSAGYNFGLNTFGKLFAGEYSGGKAVAAIVCNLLFPMLYAGIVRALFAGGGDDDEDKALKAFLREEITFHLQGAPFLNAAADSVAGALLDDTKRGENLFQHSGLEGINQLIRAGKKVAKAIKTENPSAVAYRMAEVAGLLTKIPLITAYEKFRKLAGKWQVDLPAPDEDDSGQIVY